MATERYEYAVTDNDTGEHYIMPERMAEAVLWVVPGCSTWRRVERYDDSGVVSHGEWHPVETAGGAT